MSLAIKIINNSLAQLGGRFLGTVLGLVAVAMMTRYLGSAEFGQYTTIMTYASVFAIAADMGLTLVASQMINRVGIDEKKILANLFAFRSLTALAMIGLAPLTVWWMPYDAVTKLGVVVATMSFWFVSANQVFVSVFQKRLATERIALAEIVSRALLVLLTGWVIMTDRGLLGMVAAMTISNAMYFALHWLGSLSLVRFSWRFDWLIWKEIMQLSWPLMLTIVSNLVYLKADIMLLSVLASPAEVGLYGAAYKVVDILVSVPFMVAGLVLPMMVNYWSVKNKVNFASTAQALWDAMAVAVWPILLGGLVLAVPIMVAVTGREFAVSGQILKILLLAVVAVYFSCALTHTIIALAKQKKLIIYYLMTAVTAVPVYVILIKNYGVYGAAWGTVYSELLICGFAWFCLTRESEVSLSLNVTAKSFVAALIMAAILWPMSVIAESLCGLIVLVGLGMVIYLLLINKLGLLKALKMANWQYGKKNSDN